MTTALFDFFHELNKCVSGDLRTDEYSRILYSNDASLYQVKPHGVLLPKSIDDVQAAVELAGKYQVPLLPRTGGTSLAGQAVNEALIIDFTRYMDSILELNVAEQWVRVQPGVVLDELNAHLLPTGWQFGPDPASSNRAALGGIVANNSTGAHSILYGMTADHLLAVDVLLNDGSRAHLAAWDETDLKQNLRGNSRLAAIAQAINQLTQDPANQQILRQQTPRHWRRCGGYNLDRMLPLTPLTNGKATEANLALAQPDVSYKLPRDSGFNLASLLCGSEGTLALMTEMTLKLVPRPSQTALAVISFAGLRQALTAVPLLLESNPSAVELLDNRQLLLCRQAPQYSRLLNSFLQGNPYCLLIVEFYGENEVELKHKLAGLARLVKNQGVAATAVTPILDPQLQKNVWQVRKGGLGLLMSVRGDVKPISFIEDSAVPVEHLAAYVDKLTAFCQELNTELAVYAHASAGCLHIRPLINTKKAEEVAKMPRIAEFVVDLLQGYGGAWSSEHGDGRSRSWLNETFFGPELYGLYRQVKHIFDPENLFNPGNIVDAGPMTENLRFGAAYEVIPLQTRLDFSTDQGFSRAIEMCNGAGICRKRTTGAMCPSFMVTREEEHSTRGRANALRAALSGQLPPSELTGQRMYEVMDWCVACKACKSECPSSVDMAKIKTEFLAQYHEVHGIPWRDRLFAGVTTVSRLSSGRQAPIANASLRNGVLRRVMERALGISAGRELPPFARQTFKEWFENRPVVGAQRAAPLQQVVLFADTMTNYHYPHIGRAAVAVLEAAGFEVIVPSLHDCGRPAFSKGLIEKARQALAHTVQLLRPFADQNLPILFLEPSDLSMLLDDAMGLLGADGRVDQLAAHCFSFEQFIAQLADAGELNLTFTEEPRQVMLHGHCHQKALFGTAATRRVLALPPHYSVTELDTSCCGMAGSFGYEAEHQAISMAMADRRLLPAVREAAETTLIVAPGVSCRQQIKHGSGRQALHPAEVLQAAMKPIS